MNTITMLRLENRMLISQGREHDIIELSKKHNIPIVLGVDGNYESGPYIERIYKKPTEQLTVEEFKTFIDELIPMADMYRGVKAFTYSEMSIKVLIEKDGITLETPLRSYVACYMDTETDLYVMKSINPEVDKIRRLDSWQQLRITREGYQLAKQSVLVPVLA